MIGKVGAGKTSLMLTILKELHVTKGAVSVDLASIAYAEQNPLIITGSVRDNILFGKPYNAKRYLKVVKACALEEDFTRLSKGDLT